MQLNGKRVRLDQLQTELTAAGISVRGLGIAGDDLHTYTVQGEITDVPAAAAPIVAAHVPGLTTEEQADAADERDIDTIVTALQNNQTLTAAQRRRLDLYLIRRVRRQMNRS